MTTRIRNTKGGDSAYTLERSPRTTETELAQGARCYLVVDERRGLSWTIVGHNTESIEASDEQQPPRTPPAYVIARVHQEWARDQLRDTLKPGDTVYTTLNHVSSSGMFRRIGVRAIVNNEPQYLDGLVMIALGIKSGDKEGVPMGGCGMDMGFALVYDLSYALYPHGFDCIDSALDKAHHCPANDHNNPGGKKRGPDVHHNSGGYALNHRWL